MIQVIDILILTLRNAILPQDEDKAVFSQSKGHSFHPLFGACIYVFFTQTADVIQRQTATIMIGRLEAINMKTNSADIVDFSERKFTLADVFANQHPVINGWIMLSAVAIVALYAITFTTV